MQVTCALYFNPPAYKNMERNVRKYMPNMVMEHRKYDDGTGNFGSGRVVVSGQSPSRVTRHFLSHT